MCSLRQSERHFCINRFRAFTLIAGLELSLKTAFPLPSWKAEQTDIGGTQGDLQSPRGEQLVDHSMRKSGTPGWRSKSIEGGEPQAEPIKARLTIKAPQVKKPNWAHLCKGKHEQELLQGGEFEPFDASPNHTAVCELCLTRGQRIFVAFPG